MSLTPIDPAGRVEDVSLHEAAERYGTPLYVYSAATVRQNIKEMSQAFAGLSHKIHYSVKANSNLAILQLCKEAGCGFDIVSGGELVRVLRAGGTPQDIIFSGVGKTTEEIDLALKLGIACFNVESDQELHRIKQRAQMLDKVAPVSIRVNPDVDAQTHPYISTGLRENKFGVSPEAAEKLYAEAHANKFLQVMGIDCHIGSQIGTADPLVDALYRILELVDRLEAAGIPLEHIDLGGGMGITYSDEEPLDLGEYGARVQQAMAARSQQIFLEPGRSIVANAGILLTHVEYIKPGINSVDPGASHDAPAPNFAVVDAAMNDLIRPALYQAWHNITNVAPEHDEPIKMWNVVGPVCESGDFLGKQRPLSIKQDDLLAVGSAGAYGMVQASNYNSRPRAAEVLIDGSQMYLVRRRESIEDLLQLEAIVGN
ncbi:MAG: diaminopimelate decarboxylase [Pseudomonadota bacterium]